jgi:hypothetical protein
MDLIHLMAAERLARKTVSSIRGDGLAALGSPRECAVHSGETSLAKPH